MKKYLLRVGAFCLDMLIVYIIASIICLIPFINPNVDKIDENQKALQQEYELAKDLSEKTENYIKDNKINQFEYKEILDQFPTYYELFKDVVIDEELKDEFKDNIKNNINEKYTGIYNDYTYTINKMSLIQTVVTIITCLLYFGVLSFINHGQTLAKKLLRLKVVNTRDEEKDIPLWKYLIRAFLICETIFTITNLIMINVMPKNAFINVSYWVKQTQFLYELAFLICLVLREDQRSIHDLLLGTSVILLDKEGNKVPDPIYPLPDTTQEVKDEKVVKEVKSSPKKTTKKNSNTKKVNKKKEEVKAEKIND